MIGNSCNPSRCSSRQADESWPLPPSTMIRSGKRTAKIRIADCGLRIDCIARRSVHFDGIFLRKFTRSAMLHDFPVSGFAISAIPEGSANIAAAPPPPCWQNHPGLRRSESDSAGNYLCRERRLRKQTIEATTCVVEMFEISKHSMTEGCR